MEYVYRGNGHGHILSTRSVATHTFEYGREVETDPKRLGFDLSYVGSAYGLRDSMNVYGRELAQAIEALRVDMKAKKGDDIEHAD